MKNIYKITLFTISLVFSACLLLNSEFNVNIDEGKREVELSLRNSSYNDESPGYYVDEIPDGIFDIYDHYLYYYSDVSNNGSIYVIDLDYLDFIPFLVQENLGNVIDIDVESNAIYLATSEYNNGIMRLDLGTLSYRKLVSSPYTPLKISSDHFFGDIDIIWITTSNGITPDDIYHWSDSEGSLNIVAQDINPIGIQMVNKRAIYYNSNLINLYNTGSKSIELTINSVGILSAFFDEPRDSIVYSQDDDYDETPDGQIRKYDLSSSSTIIIKNDCNYPIDVCCTSNYIYWIERGYWSSHTMIYRYSYYYTPPDTHYISRVSRAHGNLHSDKIRFEPIQYMEENYGAYWGSNYNLYIINGSDTNPPEKIDWSTSDKTVYVDNWEIRWAPSYDLNGIQYYELWESTSSDFSSYTVYWISSTEIELSNKPLGNYYYRIRANDSMDYEESNIGEWSDILTISYQQRTYSEPEGTTIPGYPLIVLISGIFVMVTVVLSIQIKRKKDQFDTI
ncbi:MAG: hypothetical protein ACFFBP_13600 [Promethearchaeota archaeon]